jgi:hypothetical protein
MTMVLSRVRGPVINNTGSGLDDWIYWHLLQSILNTINYDSSQSMTAQDSLHSLLDFSIIVTHLILMYESITSPTNDLRTTKDEWWPKNELRMNYVSPLYIFGANRIEITTSNSSSIIPYTSVAVETRGNFLATLWFPQAYPLLPKRA